MNTQRIAAILLLVASSFGLLGLGYGGFGIGMETHQIDIGPLPVSAGQKQYVDAPVWADEEQPFNVPVWAGVGALLMGGLLLASSRA